MLSKKQHRTMGIRRIVFIFCCLYESSWALDPCTSPQLIDEPLRSTGYLVKDKDYENLICDRLLPVGWYKFSGGNTMSETCPDMYKCGTHVPLWLNGAHPSVADGVTMMQVCGHTPHGCCGYRDTIRVKNCGTFYVYELKPTQGCSAGYCAGTGVPCPPDKWSPSGFEPGCIPAYPKMTQSPHLSNPIVKPDTFEFNCHIPFDPTRTDVGFEVTWLFGGKPAQGVPKMQVTGSHRDAQLDQKYIEDHLGKDLTCAVSTYFLKSPGRKGPPVPSNPYWVGIRLSTPRLTVGENEKPKTVELISTIPIVCSKAAQATCKLEVYLDPNNHDIRQTTSCTQTLKPTDWNPVTNQAVTTFQVLAERDYKKDGDKLLDLHFRPIFSVDAPPVFNNYQIPYLQIQTKDKDTALCSCTGDPHCQTMDRQLAGQSRFNYYKVGEFTMYKSTSRPFEVQARTWHCGKVSCNCAVAAREGNDVITIDMCHGSYGHTYPKVNIQHQGQLSQGTVVHQNKAGTEFLIDFPSGAWVKAVCGRSHMDIYIHAPEEDFSATEGLCGTFNRRTSDDLKDREGHIHPWNSRPDAFTESWRVPVGTSMFDKEVPIETKYNNDIYYCNCDQAKKLVDCRLDGKAARPGVHTRCASCSVVTAQGGSNTAGRRRRAAPSVTTDGPLNYFYDYGFLWFPSLSTFPTKSGITQKDAEKACHDAFNASPVVRKCVADLGIDTTPDIDACVEDIQQMDNHDFVQSAVESAIMNCVEIAIKNPQYFDNSTGLPSAFLTTDRCPSDCSGHGACVHGVCRCHSGFAGDACEFNTSQGAHLTGIESTSSYMSTSDTCDTSDKPCRTVVVTGENIAPSSNIHCRLAELKYDNTKFVPTGHTITVGADYISMYSVRCRLPTRTSTDGHVIGYNISVSTDGTKYSNAVPSYIIDSTCLDCMPTGGQCSIRLDTCLIDGICRGKGEFSPHSQSHKCDPAKNNKQWTVVHVATHPTTKATESTHLHSHTPVHTVKTTSHPAAHTTPHNPFPVAPLGGTELARFDVWTITKAGCPCSFNASLFTCACCDDGGCQCQGSNTHQCVHCGDTKNCGTPQPGPDFGVDGYTLALADCQCKFDPTQYNCACCQEHVSACQCGPEHRNQCVDCHHMDRCGSKPWIFGPAIPST